MNEKNGRAKGRGLRRERIVLWNRILRRAVEDLTVAARNNGGGGSGGYCQRVFI